MAHVFLKGATDHVIVLEVREALDQPFVAPGWTDLRIAFYLSLTDHTNDDVTTGLAETLGDANPGESFWIGFKTRGLVLPGNAGQSFIGFSNWGNGQIGHNKLVSSDAAGGTSNAYFWRPSSDISPFAAFYMLDNNVLRYEDTEVRAAIHFAQDPAHSGGYAGLIGIRMIRPSPISNQITVLLSHQTYSADMGFSDTPDATTLLAGLETWPTSVDTLGPFTFNQIPDSVFCYWPYSLSRLRIHSRGILKLVS